MDKNKENRLLSLFKRAQGEQKKRLIEDFERQFGLPKDQLHDSKHNFKLQCPSTECNKEGHIVSNGHFDKSRTRHRYICRGCGLHFNDDTGTFFHNRKLRKHISAFLLTMLEGLSIRETANTIGISPTTAHAWRKAVLQYIENNLNSFLGLLSEKEIAEQSRSEFKPSRKGLSANHNISENTQILTFRCNRHGRFSVNLTKGDSFRRPEQLTKNETSIHIPDNCKSRPHFSYAERRRKHYRNVHALDDGFASEYKRMRGVAQPYLLRYALWYCLRGHLFKWNEKDRLYTLQRLCL